MDCIVYGVANSRRQLSDFQMLIVSASCSVVSDSATLWTVDCSVNGVLQSRMLEEVAIPFSMGFPTRIEPESPALQEILYHLSPVDSDETKITPEQKPCGILF